MKSYILFIIYTITLIVFFVFIVELNIVRSIILGIIITAITMYTISKAKKAHN